MDGFRTCLSSFAAGLAVVTPLLAAQPQTQPSGRSGGEAQAASGEDREARASLEKLLDEGNLLLSTSPNSSSQRFEACVTMIVPLPGGGSTASDYVVARDGDDVAILIRSPEGKPFGYAANGLLVSLDQRERGRLALCARGAPRFALAGDGTHLDLEFSFGRMRERPDILINLSSLLRDAVKAATRVERDRANAQSIHLAGPKSDMWVVFAPDPGPGTFPLHSFVVKSKTGPILAVSGVNLDGHVSSILGLRREKFTDLNLPTVDVTSGKGMSLLLVPNHFAETPAENAAANQLQNLFPRAPAASGEKKQKENAPATRPTSPAKGPSAAGVRQSLNAFSKGHSSQTVFAYPSHGAWSSSTR